MQYIFRVYFSKKNTHFDCLGDDGGAHLLVAIAHERHKAVAQLAIERQHGQNTLQRRYIEKMNIIENVVDCFCIE